MACAISGELRPGSINATHSLGWTKVVSITRKWHASSFFRDVIKDKCLEGAWASAVSLVYYWTVIFNLKTSSYPLSQLKNCG